MANTTKQIRNYIQRQNNWIKVNNLKPGDTVLIRKTHESHSKGWDLDWTNHPGIEMDNLVGKKVEVVDILRKERGIQIDVSPVFDPDNSSLKATIIVVRYKKPHLILLKKRIWFVPYTVLQKVE